ncbi:MAG TPA: AAA family ATPase, partial [Chloroflexia bacterium]|nr:AAA family ATPase [Chloroflexia bacterium]
MAVPLDRPIVCSVLIGRTSHMAALEARSAQAAAGQGQTVLVSGEAGIGKSRLVAATRAQWLARGPAAPGAGPAILQGQCFEPDRALPYGPLLDLLRTLLLAGPAEDRTRLLGPAAPDLAGLLPELAPLLPARPPAPAREPEQEKRHLFQALMHFFVQPPTAGAARLIIVEDLHWCDETSLEFLLILARRIAEQPILLLLTYRSDELHPALGHFLAELDRARLASELPLAPLTPGELDSLIRAIFPQAHPVHADFLTTLYDLTEGNPFFAEEVLKSLLAGGEIFYTAGAWSRKPVHELHIPRTVQDAVQRRSQQLSPPARNLLLVAAVAGRRSDFPLLQQVTGTAERDLLGLIKELIAGQLMVEESADRFAFRHALTRQAVYAGLLLRERKALHRT